MSRERSWDRMPAACFGSSGAGWEPRIEPTDKNVLKHSYLYRLSR
jgi:hypothetical protein